MALNRDTHGAQTSEYSAQIARKVAYVFQNPDDQIFGRDVLSEVSFVPRMLDLPEEEAQRRIKQALELTGLTGFEHDNPQDFPLAVRKFVAIASTLVSDARYVILDEPTAGLDVSGKRRLTRILDVLSERGVAVVTISHDMRYVADHFHRVVVMRQGGVVTDDTREAVFASDDALAAARLQRPRASQLAREVGVMDPTLDLAKLAERISEKVRAA